MSEAGSDRPHAVRDAAEESDDPRISAVLEVLGGEHLDVVASRWAVDPPLLARWVRAFVEAGTAQVTNRPVGDIARQRDRFLTTFMHGLRSPLALAQMWVGLLQDVPRDTAVALEIVDHLQDALDQLDERARDVELLTAAMLGRLLLDARRVTIAELVASLTPNPRVGGEGDLVDVHVDPDLFTRILRDLWDAARSTGVEPRSVHLEVESVHPWVEVRVVRRGEPIEPAVLHAMFEPFDRDDDNARVTVGLYLARALTVVHGGTVGVEQDEQHTTFAVRIPDARLTTVETRVDMPEHDHPNPEEYEMKYQLACGDVMPGCSQTFDESDKSALLGQVAEHASAAHGITEITPEVLAAVESKIRASEG